VIHPSVGRWIVAASRDQSRHLELVHHDHGLGIRFVQQRRDRIATLEDQPPLVAAHRAITLLVREDDFVDLEEVVEQAGLLADFKLTRFRHRFPRS
jgi:hypothetical protein